MRYLDLGPIDTLPLRSEVPIFDHGFMDPKTKEPVAGLVQPPDSAFVVAFRLIAYLAAPEDARKRDWFSKNLREAFCAKIEHVLSNPEIIADVNQRHGVAAESVLYQAEGKFRTYVRDLITYEDGESSQRIETPSPEELGRVLGHGLPEAKKVGLVLSFLRSLDYHHAREARGASLNKIAHVVEAVDGWSRSEIMKAWSGWSTVAHLAAAYFDMYCVMDTEFRETHPNWADTAGPFRDFTPCIQFLGTYLAWARAYQNFGLRFLPRGSKRTLLDPETVWRVPERLDLPDVDPIPFRLEPHYLAALKEYRAPKFI